MRKLYIANLEIIGDDWDEAKDILITTDKELVEIQDEVNNMNSGKIGGVVSCELTLEEVNDFKQLTAIFTLSELIEGIPEISELALKFIVDVDTLILK